MQQSLLRKNKLVSRSVQSPANDSTRMSIQRDINNETPVEKLFNSMMKNSGKRVVIQCTNCLKLRQILANQNEIISRLQLRVKQQHVSSKANSPLPSQKKDYFKRQHLEILSSINHSVKRDAEDCRQNHHLMTKDQVQEKMIQSLVKKSIPKNNLLYQSLQPQSRGDKKIDFNNQFMSIYDQQKSKSLDLKNSESCEYSQDSQQNEDILNSGQGGPKLTLKSINLNQYSHQRQIRTRPEKQRKTWTQILNTRNQSNSPMSILNLESKLDTIHNSDLTIQSNESNDYDQFKNQTKKVQVIVSPERNNTFQYQKQNIQHIGKVRAIPPQDLNKCLQSIRQRTQALLKIYQKSLAQWQEKEKYYISQISKLHSLLLKRSK